MGRCTTRSSTHREQARAVAEAVHAVDPGLPVLGLAGSVFFEEAQRLGLRTVARGVRRPRLHGPTAQLVPAARTGAVLHDPTQIAERVTTMVNTGTASPRSDGSTIDVRVESVCVHGDSPGAVQIATRGARATAGRRESSWRRSSDAAANSAGPRSPPIKTVSTYPSRPSRTPHWRSTWLGVSTLLVDDGTSAVMTDGFFSRPSLLDVGLRRLAPSASRIDFCLNRAKVNRLAAVLPVHTHFDHVAGFRRRRRAHRRSTGRRGVGRQCCSRTRTFRPDE